MTNMNIHSHIALRYLNTYPIDFSCILEESMDLQHEQAQSLGFHWFHTLFLFPYDTREEWEWNEQDQQC